MDDDIEMADDQDQRVDYDEHDEDPDDDVEGSEDDQEDEGDVDEGEGDDEDDGDGDGDGDEEEEDEEGDQDDTSPSNRDRRGSSIRNGLSRPAEETVLSASTYLRKVEERRKLFQPSASCIDTTLGYQIEPMAAAPHSCHVHAMSLSLDGQTLITGGSDGFVRKYDVNATMNGKLMLTQNVRHGFVEGVTRAGLLSAFWPNEENPIPSSDKDRLVGVVHSLAMQQDALWGVSGSESGNINLYGLRHDPGVTRHVFRRHKGVVSALAITADDKHLISGGWDRDVHQWDLNTGQIVRSFSGHAGQISSIAFRPMASASSRKSGSPTTVSISASAADRTAQANDTPSHPTDLTSTQTETETSPLDSMQVQSPNKDEAPPAERTKAETDPQPSGPSSQTVDLTADSPDSDIVMLDKDPEDGGTAEDPRNESQKATEAGPEPTPATKSSIPSSTSTPAAATAANGADDPTEEELAFEAELNASLGLALEGNGISKADGSQFGGTLLDGEISAKQPAGDKETRSSGNGLIVAGADEDDGADDDLFGGETPTPSASGERRTSLKGAQNTGNTTLTSVKRNDSDGEDSLFGDGDEDGDGDGDMDADLDADAVAEADADGEADENNEDASSDEDMPLAGRAMVKSTSNTTDNNVFPTPPLLPNPSGGASFGSTSLSLPTASQSETKTEPSATLPTGSDKKALPKPTFGGFGIASSFDASLSTFSQDVMMTSTLSGQAILWDLRCPSYTNDEGKARGVHSLPLPEKTSPWCQSSVFSSDGSKAYIGRKNETVDEWDLRMPRLARSLRLPSGSGPVYSLATMPNSRHIICASYDNIRLWDTQFVPGTSGVMGDLKVPFKIVAGHHGASVSSLLVDPSCHFLISASGDRGWMGSSTEAVILHDIKPLF